MRILGSLLFAASSLVLPGLLTACKGSPAAPVVATHVVRGRVESLPQKGVPAAAFSVTHEAIEGWVRGNGAKGMASMTMPFPLADGVSLEGVAVGDKIEFKIEQTPANKTKPYKVVAVKVLPSETELTIPTDEEGGVPSRSE
jgi:Cu/Ag efflux protein CusF